MKDTYCHIGIHLAARCYLRFCHNGTAWQFTVLSFGLSTSRRVSTKILNPVLVYSHLHANMYLDDSVSRKYPDAGPCSKANILAKGSVPKARVGYELRYVRTVLCQLSFFGAGIHSTAVTTCVVTPFVWVLLYMMYTIKWSLLYAIRNPWGPHYNLNAQFVQMYARLTLLLQGVS